jgi:hypothetical protein
VVVEHARLVEQRLREQQRPARVAGQEDALRELGRGVEVDGGRRIGQDAEPYGFRALDRRGGEVAEYNSPKEFRELMDKVFGMMSEDPDMGPKLKAADVPQRFEFTDVDMVLNIRPTRDGEEGNLHWEWTDDVDWEATVRMAMTSETANRYFQGQENIALAIARRRIKAGGDVKAALAILPLTKPVYEQYRELVEREYPHLAV